MYSTKKRRKRYRTWACTSLLTAAMLLPSVEPALAADLTDSVIQQEVNGRSVITEANESIARAEDAVCPKYAEAYERMTALQSKYPEGMKWTNDTPYSTKNYYQWNGGPVNGVNIVSRGCAAFAMELSDAAFGTLPNRSFFTGNFKFEDVKVGDIMRVDSNNHVVIVLKVTSGGVVLAEGNYGGTVHWGRVMSKAEVEAANQLLTRYPKGYTEADDKDDEIYRGSENGLTWSLTKGRTLTISGKGVIPNYSVNDNKYPSWYSHKDEIYTVVIEEGVTGIGDYAFYQYKDLMNIYIPNGVTRIGTSAFQEAGLVAVTIPGSVGSIGADAFRSCAYLVSVSTTEGLKTIGDNAFRGCTQLQYIDFPATITSVGAGAFMDCTKVISIRFKPGTGDVQIGSGAFARCQHLKFVTLPKTLSRISDDMFSSCTSLYSIYIPESVSKVGMNPFTSTGLQYGGTLQYGGSESKWKSNGGQFVLIAMRNMKIEYNVPYVDPFDVPSGDGMIDDHDHNWSTEWSSNAAGHWHVCVNEGCGITENTEKDSYGTHTYGDWVVDEAAKVGQAGSQHRECTVCGHRQTEPIAALEHTHAWSEAWSHDDTGHWRECVNEGCGITDSAQKDGYAIHTYDDWEVVVEPTVGKEGIQYRRCTVCNHDQIETIETLEHEHRWSEDWSKDDSCHWRECIKDDCDITNNIQKDGYGGHTYGDWEVETSATNDQDGVRYIECTVCGYRQKESIPADGHEHIWSNEWSYDKDWHWNECTKCEISDDILKGNYGPHSYGEWMIETEATVNHEGLRYQMCKCGARQDEIIPVLAHSWSADWNKNETHHWRECLNEVCEITENELKDRYGEHLFTDWTIEGPGGSRFCTECGYHEIYPISTDHREHNWSTEWNKDGTGHWKECLNDACNILDNAQKNGYETHNYSDWKIDENGNIYKDCIVCGYHEIYTAAVGGHEHHWSTEWNTDGIGHWIECLNDGCTITDYTQKNGYGEHIYGEWMIDQAVAAGQAGSQHRECIVCGYSETETIPALPAPPSPSTPIPTPTQTVTPEPTPTGTPGLEPTVTPEPTPTGTPETEPTVTPTPTLNPSPKPTTKPGFEAGKTFTSGKASYQVTKAGAAVELTRLKSTSAKVTINTVKGKDGVEYKVTSIGPNAMKGNRNLKNLTIGNNVKHIKAYAFSGCTNLSTITFGKNVTTIQLDSFKGCSGLKKPITLPDSVAGIGIGAFSDCANILAINIGKTSGSNLMRIKKNAFNGCRKLSKITIKSTKLNTVEGQPFKNTKNNMKVKVPSKQLTKYKKLLKKAGLKANQITK